MLKSTSLSLCRIGCRRYGRLSVCRHTENGHWLECKPCNQLSSSNRGPIKGPKVLDKTSRICVNALPSGRAAVGKTAIKGICSGIGKGEGDFKLERSGDGG